MLLSEICETEFLSCEQSPNIFVLLRRLLKVQREHAHNKYTGSERVLILCKSTRRSRPSKHLARATFCDLGTPQVHPYTTSMERNVEECILPKLYRSVCTSITIIHSSVVVLETSGIFTSIHVDVFTHRARRVHLLIPVLHGKTKQKIYHDRNRYIHFS
jgi:hypothetical protein